MKFQVDVKFQVVTRNFVTNHDAVVIMAGADAVMVAVSVLEKLAEDVDGLVTNVVLSAAICHKPSIREMVADYIVETGLAKLVEDGLTVEFLDEGELIPLDDLGYSKELGFYQISLFPDVSNEARD